MEQDPASFKASETLNKQQQLLSQGKFYEYSQKVKLLSNRKLQTSKFEEALYLLSGATHKLLHHHETNEAFELLTNWVAVLEDHPELYHSKYEKIILELYNFPQLEKRPNELERVLKKFGRNIEDKTRFCVLLSKAYLRLNKFAAAEKYAVKLDLDAGLQFLRAWEKVLSPEQMSIVTARFALWKLIEQKPKESQSILSIIPGDNGFKAFATLVLKCLKCKSKDGFLKLRNAFEYLLKDQPSYAKVFDEIGMQYFSVQKNERQEGGLLGGLLK